MLPPINKNLPLYNLTSKIENNAILNRGLMETFGVEIPWTIMGNNKDEKIERLIRAAMYTLASLIIPVISMPFINKLILKNTGIIKNIGEAAILRVSKKYLTKDADLMLNGFKETAKELAKNPKFKDISTHFNNVLDRFPDKEKLRKDLIKAHQHIFSIDFAISSLFTISIPWISNYITEKRTKRSGYVGEFKIADKKYTDKMTQKHEKSKKYKIAFSYLLAAIPAFVIPKLLSRAMLSPVSKLGSIGKFFKNKAHLFDYTKAIYMSKAAYAGILAFGDFPTYMLACRDKHELKMRSTAWLYMIAMLFGGDHVLNNATGRLCDKKFGTTLMNREGFEKAGFFKKLLMSPKRFEKLDLISNVSKLTKKAALGMYWGNFILTTLLLGFGLPYIQNKMLRKDVKEDQKNIKNQAKT